MCLFFLAIPHPAVLFVVLRRLCCVSVLCAPRMAMSVHDRHPDPDGLQHFQGRQQRGGAAAEAVATIVGRTIGSPMGGVGGGVGHGHGGGGAGGGLLRDGEELKHRRMGELNQQIREKFREFLGVSKYQGPEDQESSAIRTTHGIDEGIQNELVS